MNTLEMVCPVDPVRRRLLQGAFSTAMGLALPGRGEKLAAARKPLDAHVHINQVGYLPAEPKRAVVAANDDIPGTDFKIVDDSPAQAVRFSGSLREYMGPGTVPRGIYSRHYLADFDRFTRPGRYRVRLANGKHSAPFSIDANLYKRLTPRVLGYFDIQRCGEQAHPARSRCHVDDGVIYGGPRHGQAFDASGGWHDAGDFLKFVETTSYVTALMLFGLDSRTDDRHARAREESAAMLAQARVGLEWLLKMHPAPDELYFQVGDESDHDVWRLPEDDAPARNPLWKPRTVFYGVGANLAGRCAAAFAMGARHYRAADPAFAGQCRRAAESVYALGQANPKTLTTEPASFYPERTWHDDMEWGAIELYRTTGQPAYLQQALEFAREAGPAGEETSVYNVHALAHYTLVRHAPRAERDRLLHYLRDDAELIRRRADNPYSLGTPYVWGTADAAAGSALTCLLYSEITHESEYRQLARRQRDFILGCNPFGVSCVIGAGTRYPRFPHHQIANIANIELTGAVVGGPASAESFDGEDIDLQRPSFDNMKVGPEPADDSDDMVVYHDAAQDYVTNEPANDYTAKFLLLSSFYERES
jgi:endoglucanase